MTNKNAVMERYFLDCRCMLLELAATLDRHDRAPAPSEGAQAADARLLLFQRSIEILAHPSARPDRTARILELLSRPVS